MILSDVDIRKEIAAGRIQIEPFDEACVQPSSVDLHADSQLLPSPAENPYGSKETGSKYQGQRGPTASRFFEEFRES